MLYYPISNLLQFAGEIKVILPREIANFGKILPISPPNEETGFAPLVNDVVECFNTVLTAHCSVIF